jgi:ankyrin repeat protein
VLCAALVLCTPAFAGGGRPSATALAEAAERADEQAVRALIKAHVDVNAPGSGETSALLWVIRRQNLALAHELIRAGADVNEPNGYGMRPLHLAIDNSDAVMVRLLLQSKADPAAADSTGEPALLRAAKIGNLDVVDALLEAGAAVDAPDPGFQQTPLMAAARGGYAPVVKRLIERGAQINAQTRTGATPKFLTPANSKASRGAGIQRGGWPDRGIREPIPGAKTPLLYAAREGHVEVARLLLDAGARIEQGDADGVTPLLAAVINEHAALASFLIDRGANANASDWYGQTPLFCAIDVRNLDVSGASRDNGIDRGALYRLAEVLLKHGANPNARTREFPPQRPWVTRLGSLSWVDFTGQTPFLRAALAGDVKAMRLLLQYGANPNIATEGGTTPLMAAAGVNWTVDQTFDEGEPALLEAVKLAHSLGNDINARNVLGIRAIHGAANRGANEIIRYLVEQGADLDAMDNEKRTPLVWAQGVFLATHPPEKKPETIALLQELQARRPASRGTHGAAAAASAELGHHRLIQSRSTEIPPAPRE